MSSKDQYSDPAYERPEERFPFPGVAGLVSVTSALLPLGRPRPLVFFVSEATASVGALISPSALFGFGDGLALVSSTVLVLGSGAAWGSPDDLLPLGRPLVFFVSEATASGGALTSPAALFGFGGGLALVVSSAVLVLGSGAAWGSPDDFLPLGRPRPLAFCVSEAAASGGT